MATATREKLPAITMDPTGELHGIPTYIWGMAPEGLATRRQLAAMGLRKNGQAPVAQVRRGRLIGYLYRIDLAAPQFTKTPAKLAAVHTAARSRQKCAGPCGRTDLGYIPRQAAPCWGVCWDCMGLSAPDTDQEQQ